MIMNNCLIKKFFHQIKIKSLKSLKSLTFQFAKLLLKYFIHSIAFYVHVQDLVLWTIFFGFVVVVVVKEECFQFIYGFIYGRASFGAGRVECYICCNWASKEMIVYWKEARPIIWIICNLPNFPDCCDRAFSYLIRPSFEVI